MCLLFQQQGLFLVISPGSIFTNQYAPLLPPSLYHQVFLTLCLPLWCSQCPSPVLLPFCASENTERCLHPTWEDVGWVPFLQFWVVFELLQETNDHIVRRIVFGFCFHRCFNESLERIYGSSQS